MLVVLDTCVYLRLAKRITRLDPQRQLVAHKLIF